MYKKIVIYFLNVVKNNYYLRTIIKKETKNGKSSD
jgi:hypothetical protein